nr:hypothetical protein [uncultured Actinoplanes sp.]
MSEYGAEQLTAGFRSMHMLAGLVERGGRPAAVSPTIPLCAGEKQYGWFPVRVGATGRRVAVITNQRLIVGDDIPLRSIVRIMPIAGEWSVALQVRGRCRPLVLGGPWVPWMSVVLCAELYGTAWPPGRMKPGGVPGVPAAVPAPRRKPAAMVATCPSRRAD